MMKMRLKSIVCVLLVLMVAGASLSSCKDNTGNDRISGLIKSVVASKTAGEFVLTDTEFKIQTYSSASRETVEKCIAVYPEADFELSGSGTDYVLKLKTELESNLVYSIKSLLSDRVIYSWAFMTANPFEVTKMTAPKTNKDNSISFELSFNDVTNFDECFSISPETEGKITHENNIFTFTANDGFMPETRYSICIKKELSTSSGLTLEKDYCNSFTPEYASYEKYVGIVRNDGDYANSYVGWLQPTVKIKHSKALCDTNATVKTYSFFDFKSYTQAHEQYFNAPDFRNINDLTATLDCVLEFDWSFRSFEDYNNDDKTEKYDETNKNGLLESELEYPDNESLSEGYYISEIKTELGTVYHVFQVSLMSVYTMSFGNSIVVWVNNTMNSKPLTDTEVLLDNEYDVKTNENGVAVFNLSSNDDETVRKIVINNPSNSNVPYISYIHTDGEYDEASIAKNYDCTIFSDQQKYTENETAKIFGIVSPKSSAPIPSNVSLIYGDNEVDVALDENGAFVKEIELKKFTSDMQVYLNIGSVTVAKTIIKYDNQQSSCTTKKPMEELYATATYDGSTLDFSVKKVSNVPTAIDSTLDYSASVDAKEPRYVIGTEDVEYTLSVTRKNAHYNKHYHDSYEGVDYGDDSGINAIYYTLSSGKTENGKASIPLNYENKPEEGIYYSFEISYIYNGGIYGVTVNMQDDESILKNTSPYCLHLDKSLDLCTGETVKGVVMNGNDTVKDGKVLYVIASNGINGIYASSPDDISFNMPKAIQGKAYVLAVYFDGEHMYVLNKIALSSSSENRMLNVDIKCDKTSYAKGDKIDAQISVTDKNGEPFCGAVLVRMSQDAGFIAPDFANTNPYILSKTLKEQVNGYSGSSNIEDISQTFVSAYYSNYSDVSYFFIAKTNSSGKADITLTAPLDSDRAVISVVALGKMMFGQNDIHIDCKAPSPITVDAPDIIDYKNSYVINCIANNDVVSATETTTASATTTTAAADNSGVKCNISLYTDNGEALNDKNKVLSEDGVITEKNSHISFNDLSIGKYVFVLQYEFSGEKHSVEHHFEVSGDNTKIKTDIQKLSSDGLSPNMDDKNDVCAVVFGKEYENLVSLAAKRLDYSDNSVTALLANMSAMRLFGGKVNEQYAASFQQNGVTLNKSKSENLTLSAICAAIDKSAFDTDKLKAFFDKYYSSKSKTTKMLSLFGKAALNEPILNELYSYSLDKSLNDEQKLILTLSFLYIGDYDSATAIFDKFNDKIQIRNGEARIANDKSDGRITAYYCLAAAKLQASGVDKLIKYLQNNKPSITLAELCLAEYINCYINTSSGSFTIKYSENGKSNDIKIAKSRLYSKSILQTNSTDVSISSDDEAYVCFAYIQPK